MDYNINEYQLYDYFVETINSCGNFILTSNDEEIEYNIFEVFDINVHTFLHIDNLNKLLFNKLISEDVYNKSQLIREKYLEIENTDDWSIRGVKNSSAWKDIMDLCDSIKQKIKT